MFNSDTLSIFILFVSNKSIDISQFTCIETTCGSYHVDWEFGYIRNMCIIKVEIADA